MLQRKKFNDKNNQSLLYILKSLIEFLAEIAIDSHNINTKIFISQTLDLNALIDFISTPSNIDK